MAKRQQKCKQYLTELPDEVGFNKIFATVDLLGPQHLSWYKVNIAIFNNDPLLLTDEPLPALTDNQCVHHLIDTNDHHHISYFGW